MKRKILVYILLAVNLTLLACSDSWLDTKPLDKFTEEDVWNDANLAEAFVYGAYNKVINDYLRLPEDGGNQLGESMDDYSDDVITKSGNKVIRDQMDKYYDEGWDVFDDIRQCNIIIDKATESAGLRDDEKESLIAKGRMLRAMIYYSRARIFGKYVLIDHTLTVDDDLELPRSSTIKETYDFILADLAFAAEHLPEKAKLGALSKGAALALTTEVAIQGASYIESGAEDYYQKASDAGQVLLDMGQYAIDSNYAGLFNDYDYGISSKENILLYLQSSDITYANHTRMVTLIPTADASLAYDWCVPTLVEHVQGWCERWPSSELVDAYLVTDADGVAKKWNETSYYQQFQANGGYVSKAIYTNRDKRFEASVVQDSSSYFRNRATIREGGNLHYTSSMKHLVHMTKSGYYFRKGVYEQEPFMPKLVMSHHLVIYRLGRAVLNYAEAELRLGHISKAIELINRTRTVHGGLPALSPDLNAADAWTYYKIERHADLFYEGDRYWSLLRWAKAEGKENIPELDQSMKCINIAKDGKSFEMIKLPYVNAQNIHSFSEKRFLFPVPEGERLLNKNLDQNPGW